MARPPCALQPPRGRHAIMNAVRASILCACGLLISLAAFINPIGQDVVEPEPSLPVGVDPGWDANVETRVHRLQRVCQKYSDPFRPESIGEQSHPGLSSLGSEVVFLYSKHDVASVCIPHKVGSHSWGRFTQKLPKHNQTWQDWQASSWSERLDQALRVVVVRHPFERLISVYRMVFENWCDSDRFLAKQWHNVCQSDFQVQSPAAQRQRQPKARPGNSVTNFFGQMLDEHRHGNDRFIQEIWKKFHPRETLFSPKHQLRFTFSEFVRFLVNGTLEFPSKINQHPGLSYHWAPYWRECALCALETRPHVVIHMETFSQDFGELMDRLELSEHIELFPHTHTQTGGHSSALGQKYFSSITRGEVMELFEKYRLDHELFGYSVEPYLAYAQG